MSPINISGNIIQAHPLEQRHTLLALMAMIPQNSQ